MDNNTTLTVQPVAPTPEASEAKEVRFKNRAENQASKILSEIESIKKLANKKYYSYSDAQVEELFGAIQSALDDSRKSFSEDKPEKAKLFTFSA